MIATPPTPPTEARAPDPIALLRSRSYLMLLVLAALLGVPISFAAYGFLSLVHYVQHWVYGDLPSALGLDPVPLWWPVPVLALAGLLVGLIIRYLPGGGGHVPAHGFGAGQPRPVDLPGVVLAALVGLGLGAVLGPEAPLIALGAGLAITAVNLIRRDLPERSVMVVGVTGSFAAVSTLLGSPLIGAFLLMELIGISGPTLTLVLLPGLLAAGIGSLIFVGLGDWTGLGPLSLTIPDLPTIGPPSITEFGWAIVIGLTAAVLGTAIRTGALALEPVVRRRRIVATTVAGVVMALAAIAYASLTDHGYADVLFSGQDAIGPLLAGAGVYSAGALVLLICAKALAYCVALATFRGGPIFPALLIGAAIGLAYSHLPGLTPINGAAAGIGAMSAVMLRFPLTSVLMPVLLLGSDALAVTPTVIVATTVAYIAAARSGGPTQSSPATTH